MAKIVRLIPETEIDPGVGTGDFWVKVIDYDGTVLLEKRGNNGDSFDLPAAPSHEGLVFQEWSASCPITNGKVVIDNNNIMAGAVYTTASGQNEFDITLTKVTGLAVALNMDGTKDWGDGTSDTATSHTYTAYGDYTIKCNGTKCSSIGFRTFCTQARIATLSYIGEGMFSGSSLKTIIISQSVKSIFDSAFYSCRALTSVVIPQGVTNITISAFNSCISLTSVVIPQGVTSINSGIFNNCISLTSVVIPQGVTSINGDAGFGGAFEYCKSLTSVVIPQGVTSTGSYVFRGCNKIANVVIPQGVTSIRSYVFENCFSLISIVIPQGVTSIEDYAFFYCSSVEKYDFSQCTAIPTLSYTRAFEGINAICKIIVPDSLYDEWIAAANWSTYADYIYKASEVTA